MCNSNLFSKGELEKSLEFLVQRASSLAHNSTQIGNSATLTQLQKAVLALFYLTQNESERYM